jgi:hypothetical protein
VEIPVEGLTRTGKSVLLKTLVDLKVRMTLVDQDGKWLVSELDGL